MADSPAPRRSLVPFLAAAVLAALGLAAVVVYQRAGGSGHVGDVDPAAIQASLDDCMRERITEGLARLDSLAGVAPGHADVLATRGLCRSIRFTADSVQADARAAFSDLSAAIDLVQAAPDAFQTPLSRLYYNRAFVVQSMRPGDWPAMIADLDRAIDLEPRVSTFVLDRGVARAFSGDTAAARADLRRFEALAPGDSIEALSLRDLLAPRGARSDSVAG